MTSVRIDPYLVDSLLPDLAGHDHRPSAFLVYLFLWHAAGGAKKKGIACSYQEIAMRTGLAKRTVQLAVAQATPTATPVYTVLMPWKRGAG
jgi:hypothetical protein